MTPEQKAKLEEQNRKFREERRKKLQAEWYRQDVSGETEEAIEQARFNKHEE